MITINLKLYVRGIKPGKFFIRGRKMLRMLVTQQVGNLLDVHIAGSEQLRGMLHTQLPDVGKHRVAEKLLKPFFQFKLVQQKQAA